MYQSTYSASKLHVCGNRYTCHPVTDSIGSRQHFKLPASGFRAPERGGTRWNYCSWQRDRGGCLNSSLALLHGSFSVKSPVCAAATRSYTSALRNPYSSQSTAHAAALVSAGCPQGRVYPRVHFVRPSASAVPPRRRGCTVAAASAHTADVAIPTPLMKPNDLDELMFTSGEEIPYYMGPLELREVPEAGMGVFVTEDIPCGTLLLACYPLALLRRDGPTGQIPSPLELAHAMEDAHMSPLAAAWMLGLYDGQDDDDDEVEGGSASDGRSSNRHTWRRLGQLQQLFRQPFGPMAAAPPDEEYVTNLHSSPARSGVRCPLPVEILARVVTFNAYGEVKPDAAVAAMRRIPPEQRGPCVGLWPPFSLINHSCCPVASYGLVGDVMVVRAATDLQAGQQVTISYFGRRALAPLEFRRAYLAQHYGFVCGCERCTLEAPHPQQPLGVHPQAPSSSSAAAASLSAVPVGEAAVCRLPPELPAFLENLHVTCSRAATPHLNDVMTGRRWTGGGGSGGGVFGGNTPTTTTTVKLDESLSELVEELSELYGYLSESWQKLLRAAASVAGDDKSVRVATEEDEEVGEGEDEEKANGGVLTQQEMLWLEGSVFVLLDQLVVVVSVLGLLRRVEEQFGKQAMSGGREGRKLVMNHTEENHTEGGVKTLQTAAAGASASAIVKKEGVRVTLVGNNEIRGATEAAAEVPPLTAAEAMRIVAARRWRVEELPRSFLEQFVDLLAQAQEVAAAVAPGSDLAIACAVRLLYGIQAVLGPDSEEFQQAEIACYDALSARYGILEYDTYGQVLDICTELYGAKEVRLSVSLGGSAMAAAPLSPVSPLPLSADPFGAGFGGEEGGLVGLRLPAVPVEAEVV